MRERKVILDLLHRVALRLWVNRALHESGFGVCVVLFTLIAFQLVRPVLSTVTGAKVVIPVLGAGLLVFCGYVLLRVSHRATLAQAAGMVDRCGRLKDELKSAYWFLSQSKPSSFAQTQITRAAHTAERLSASQLVPALAPRSLWLVVALAGLLGITTWSLPRLSHSWDTAHAEMTEGLETGPTSLRVLLRDAPRETEVEALDRALAKLESSGASTEELQRAAAQARDAIDRANLRAAATREGLATLAEAMKGRPELEKVAKALDEGRARDAMEMLAQLKNEARVNGQSDADDVQFPQSAAAAMRSAADFRDATEASARELRRTSMRINEDAINNVLRNLEDAQSALDAQARVNQVRRSMDDFLVATSQRSALTASLFGNRAITPNATPSPNSGHSDLQGGTMYRQGAVARGDDDSSHEGSRTGSASGHSTALELEGARTERLDAKLKLETIRVQRRPDNKETEGESSWFYAPSQRQAAETQFAEVRSRDSYTETDVMSPERIPMRQQQPVRDYFTNLHESEKQ